MLRKPLAWLLAITLLAALLGGCAKKDENVKEVAADSEPVTLVVTGGWADCRALDVVGKAFADQYPNCTVVYEYVQDYYPSLIKRMAGDDPIDLFFTSNIQAESEALPYALDLYGREDFNMADTFDGLIQNFLFRGKEGDKTQLYAIPLGAEMRGLYVNKTLLNSLNIAVPTDQATFLAACQTLKDNGYIPLQGNPGNFAQLLVYPWVCNLIANADDPQAARATVEGRGAKLVEMLSEPLNFLYELVERGYYDYKRAQTEMDLFNDTTDEAYARYFLNVQQKGEEWVKADDVGRVAFMPSAISLESTIAKAKEDYHSEIEYAFIPAPIGSEGGFAYLSPAHGIAVCNKSQNLDWAVRFIDFLYKPANNQAFAEAFHIIPNTKEAFAYIRKNFDLPDNRISHLGQVTFDYGFYDLLTPVLVDISKANNPKYMQDDGSGNLSLYPLSYYLEQLTAALGQP